MGLNAFAKSIDSDQLAQSAYADLNRNVLLLDSFFTLSQTVPPRPHAFTCLQYKSFEKHCAKSKNCS